MVLFGVISFTSCETTELDLTANPNALSPEQASVDFFMNGVQVQFANFVESMGYTTGQLTRLDQMSGRDYANAYAPGSFNYKWRVAYSTIMQDLQLMNTLAVEKNLTNHIAMGQVMQAYVMLTLVDFFGDVPYTEVLQGTEGNLNPIADSGDSVYAAAIGLLDTAIAGFDNAANDPENDFFYGSDWDAWKNAANTIKMKAYMATRLVDGAAMGKFDAIVASGNYITSKSGDFQFRWGTSETQPDSRHPRYYTSYTSTGGNRYMSNSLMRYMMGANDNAYTNPDHFDIRTMYYFYRQVSATPGIAGSPADEEVLECGLFAAPAHYAGYVFCGAPKGWWGRDHGNDNGIPPDGFKRALAGSYPAGGMIDDLSYDAQVNGGGSGGNGITPILLASGAKFMIAEAKMVAGDAAGAKTAVFEAIDLSMDKVTTFAPTTDRFELIFDGVSVSWASTIGDYIQFFKDDYSADWDAGSSADQWNILANQYFVALYGNGIDAYNFYRRTGYPTTLQPNLEPNPGTFPRSMWYPANYADNNSNATQKSSVGVQVFWDNNPATGFPVAN